MKIASTHASAAFSTGRAILVAQRTDNDVVLVRDGKGSCEGCSRRHAQLHLASPTVRGKQSLR
jgi:hypothetical protein